MNYKRIMHGIVSVLALILFVAPVGPSFADDQKNYAEAQMRVQTEGLTVAEHLQRQAELSRMLLTEMPSRAAESAVRIPFTKEEVTALETPSGKFPLKIGVVKRLASPIRIHGPGEWFDRESIKQPGAGAALKRDSHLVWAVVVTSENAGAIRLHVEDMSLPEKAELYLYSRNGQAYGPYTGKGPHGTGEFWTATIFGSEAILQVRIKSANPGRVSLRVQEAGLITSNFAGSLQDVVRVLAPPAPGWPCGNENCIVDASCVGGNIADNLKLAVAKMEWVQGAFIYTCTGGLITDNNPSQGNFFLTANHCISKSTTAKNVNLYWRFATSSCNASSCPSNSGWPYQTSGATVSKTGRKADFTLMILNSAPPSGSVFLGWTTAPVANTNGANLYRVSNPNFGPQVYSQHNVDTSAGTCSGWPRGERIYSRDITGAIDGGSSGSPIVNGSLQIVGQLSGTCGFSPENVCSSGPGEDNATVDGAFAFYYSTVQPVLNP